jgi:hypothetical protein
MMPDELAGAARTLLANDGGGAPSASEAAARAEAACERLFRHFARLLGDAGTRALFHRSLGLTRARFLWIAGAPRTDALGAGDPSWAPLPLAMEHQEPVVAVEAFADFLATFVQLLGRLIGDPLVSRLLQEIWPEVFRRSGKEPT